MKELEQEIQHGSIAPHRAAEMRVELSGYYSSISGTLEDILIKKPKIWLELRETCKSDTSAEKKWSATEMGLDETLCRLRLKKAEKMMSALSSLLRVAEGQARNQY